MIEQKRSNAPHWTDIYTYVELPEELKVLEELAHNLWWSWNSMAKDMFCKLDPQLWNKTECNPVMLIRNLSEENIDRILNDSQLMDEISSVYDSYKEYMQQPADEDRPSVAYFSMEYGLSNVLKIYSGGLGVLAGDYLKEASDSNVRLTAVGFLYRNGYFTQTLSEDGQQIANYENQDFTQLPIEQVFNEDGTPMVHCVPFNGFDVYCNIWRVNVGRISLYLMDTDIKENSQWDKFITAQLYGGDWENRLKQEYLLGIGGVMLLDKLGIKKDVYHMNEGHAAFMNVQRLIEYVNKYGFNFEQALEIVRASSLYTVHTPVPAGHDYFEEGLLSKYMSHIPSQLGINWQYFMDMGRETPGSDSKFSMSVFALNTCQEANGVSKLHGKVSQDMFAPVWKGFLPQELHVGYVTNGVHMPTWAAPGWQELFSEYMGENYLSDQTKENSWAKLRNVSDKEMWDTHIKQKEILIDYIKNNYKDLWIKNTSNPDAVISLLENIRPQTLLIGFGRRFATYKRAHLLFTDLKRLSQIVNNQERPVVFVYTGKAHPADGAGQGLIKNIINISRMPEFVGKIIFLENYDMHLASKLIAGVDVWMNTPTRPLEASGTSGEKAIMNGVLNLSVLDGWWYEGYRENAGWALTDKRTFKNQDMQDKLDAATIYEIIEIEIVPLYYNRDENGIPNRWVEFMKNNFNFISPNYTMKRMMDDYFSKFYNKLRDRFKILQRNEYSKVNDILRWKKDVSMYWDEMKVVSVKEIGEYKGSHNVRTSDSSTDIILQLDKGRLSCNLDVEIVVATEDENSNIKIKKIIPLKLDKSEGSLETYIARNLKYINGHNKIAIRILPHNEDLPHRQDFAYVRWVNMNE